MKYKSIYNTLFSEISEGVYSGCAFLPSEKELCARFDAERNTVRKALTLLSDAHLITKYPGKGSKIRVHPETNPETDSQTGPVSQSSRSLSENDTRRVILYLFYFDALSQENVGLFHLNVFNGMKKRLEAEGYSLIFHPLNSQELLQKTITLHRPSGILIDSYAENSYYRMLTDSGLPCISITHNTPYFTSIVSDNEGGARNAVRLLSENGHRHILCLCGNKKYGTCLERIRGVKKAAEETGTELRFLDGDWSFRSGYEAGTEIVNLYRNEGYTALFCMNDDMAYGCMKYLDEHGIRVPQDLSVIGFDNSDCYGSLKITSVDVHSEILLDYCLFAILGAVDGRLPSAPARIQIDTSLAVNRKTWRTVQ